MNHNTIAPIKVSIALERLLCSIASTWVVDAIYQQQPSLPDRLHQEQTWVAIALKPQLIVQCVEERTLTVCGETNAYHSAPSLELCITVGNRNLFMLSDEKMLAPKSYSLQFNVNYFCSAQMIAIDLENMEDGAAGDRVAELVEDSSFQQMEYLVDDEYQIQSWRYYDVPPPSLFLQ